MKCMYTSAGGEIVDCNVLISGIYTGIVDLYLYMTYVAYEDIFVVGTDMWQLHGKCDLQFFLHICNVGCLCSLQ